jgi:hypothetical protein
MDVEYEDLTMAESATRSQNHSGMDIDSKLDGIYTYFQLL